MPVISHQLKKFQWNLWSWLRTKSVQALERKLGRNCLILDPIVNLPPFFILHSPVNFYILLTIPSCYGSILLALGLIGRDGGLSTICHNCGFACQQRVLKTSSGSDYLHSKDGVVLRHGCFNRNLCCYSCLVFSCCYSCYLHDDTASAIQIQITNLIPCSTEGVLFSKSHSRFYHHRSLHWKRYILPNIWTPSKISRYWISQLEKLLALMCQRQPDVGTDT